MTRLLISVRNAKEAGVALDWGADVLDVKEPSRGPLGAADVSIVREVVERVDGQVPVSMAAGELLLWETAGRCQVPPGVGYVKLGLAECGETPVWPERWRRAVERFPVGAAPVAVVYADWPSAKAPRPDHVLKEAVRLACPFVLVDTFDKSAGGLLDLWSLENLGRFVAAVRRCGLQLVLAGSLSEAAIRQVLPFRPELVSVRGAVCHGGRSGALQGERIGQLARALRVFQAAQFLGNA